MLRAYLLIAAVMMNAAAAAAEETPAARYSMTPIDGGALRLDTLTGSVDRCISEAGMWSCRTLPDEGRALQDEIDRLAEENARLRAKLEASGDDSVVGDDDAAEGPVTSFRLPSQAEVDKAIDFMEHVLKRFKSMVEGLNEKGEPDTAL
jgi:hypothetical protein